MHPKSTSLQLQWRCIVLVCSALLITTPTFSQDRAAAVKSIKEKFEKDKRIEKAEINPALLTPSLLKASAIEPIPVSAAVPALKALLGCRTGIDDLRSFTATQNKTGVEVTRLQQYYKNIKVAYANYSVVARGGRVEAFTGSYYQLANVSVVPLLTEAAALISAKQLINAKEYAWEQVDKLRKAETDPAKKSMLDKLYVDVFPQAELVIVKDFTDPVNATFDLAYKFDIYTADPMSRAYVFINAHSGKLMLYNRIIKHLDPDQHKKSSLSGIIPEAAYIVSMTPMAFQTQGASPSSVSTPVPTRYAGTRLVGTKQISGNDPNSGLPLTSTANELLYIPGSPIYGLIEDGHGLGEETYDLNGVGGAPVSLPGVYAQGRLFTDVDNNWTVAEHKRGGANNEAENDDYAFDAHWGATVVYDYWNLTHGRKSFDNNNSRIKSFVHYGPAYDNAFWNGTVMTYGDGSFQGGLQVGFAPLTSLDVCGHEIGHGICSFTSDLVYQGESGAMNEGYSDVWAACIENYAINNVDPTLISGPTNTNGFKIWSIGEQIDANDATGLAPNMVNTPSNDPTSTALRYMDDPNKAGDPASYAEKTPVAGSRRWSDPNCAVPNLMNDECGVHTNSGVLNHLFYLLVSGGSGTVNTVNAENASGALDGEPFNVAGIGFGAAEKIMYLAEQMISSDAKFLDTRNAAVLAAEIIYGKCSNEWRQTILAWHAVAVGSSSDTAVCGSSPKFTAAVVDNVSEAGARSATNCTDAVTKIVLTTSVLPPGNPNPLIVTITPSGTATINRDYTIQSLSINYPANGTGIMRDTIAIINDAEIESTETIVLNIHATDGAGFTADTTITITINDDDHAPVISNSRFTLLSENFDGAATGSLPPGWLSIDKGGNAVMSWKVGSGGGLSAFTTNSVMADMDLLPGVAPIYPPADPANIILRTPLINAASLTNLELTFTWAAGGEPDPGPPVRPLDYGRVFYSLDGINFQPFQFTDKLYAFSPLATRDTVKLPGQLSNKSFYLGFQWQNDDNVAVPPSFHFDSVKVTGGRQQVETKAGDGVSETQYANKDIYYLSAQDGQVIARIRNNSANLGCVTASVSEEGNGAAAATVTYNGITYPRAKKVISITPSPANTTVGYEATLYYTTAELGALSPSRLKVLKVKDGVPLTGTIANSDADLVTVTMQDNSANGYYSFVGNYNGFSQFVLVEAPVVLPVTLTSFQAFPEQNKYIKITWTTAQEININYYVIEKAVVGSNNFTAIGTVTSQRNSSVNSYSFIDNDVKAGITYQYRLRIVEDTRTFYSYIRLAKITGKNVYVNIAPNPSDGLFRVSLGGYKGKVEMIVYNELGQPVMKTTAVVSDGVPVPLNITNQPKGIYSLKIIAENLLITEKLVKQ